jgi:xylulose-5-phosphate/fructose-6-phosphate phosphoketolase
VRGYKEKGNVDTPFELAIRNQTDRYSLTIDAIDLVKSLGNTASGFRDKLLNEQVTAKAEAHNNGLDPEHIRN